MIKKFLLAAAITAVIGVLVFGAINRTQAKANTGNSAVDQIDGFRQDQQQLKNPSEASENHDLDIGGNGRGQGGNGNSHDETNVSLSAAFSELSPEESEALVYMREEEKLAHDIYTQLYSMWGLPIFQNISNSEQTHSDAVKTLLDRYGLPDPAMNEAGVFSNADLQSLYNDLLAAGSRSQTDALMVGAAVEEIDILDLEMRLAKTDNADIQQTLTNLLNGSYNHLRSFTAMIEGRTGEKYQPQYLSPEAYQNIISLSPERGGGMGQGRGSQSGGNGRWKQIDQTNS